jgi:aspartate carbamoyltransferase catalytic subunit
MHSRVARSNILLLNTMGARVRVVGALHAAAARHRADGRRSRPRHARGPERRGYRDDAAAAARAHERLVRAIEPEYFHYFGLDQKKLAYAKPDALVMHPGPMNRGVEIDSLVPTARSR